MNAPTSQSIRRSAVLIAAFGLCGLSAATHAQTTADTKPVEWTRVSVELPVTSAVLPAGDGDMLANGYCLMCHSADMVMNQPPLTEQQWLAEIRKMRSFWGLPMPASEDAALAKYLVKINGPRKTATIPPATAAK